MGCPAVDGCVGYELGEDDASAVSLTFNTGDPSTRTDDEYYNGGAGWEPIGNASNSYSGVFQGNGHVISDLSIHRAGRFIGLFGRLGSAGRLVDVGLANVDVRGQFYVGSLVGYSRGTISNSSATGTVSGTDGGFSIGGLVGINDGAIDKSYAKGAVFANDGDGAIGGFAGGNLGTISESYATGVVSGGDGSVGGFVGSNRGMITDCHATGAVSGDESVGGFVGSNDRDHTIIGSYAAGAVIRSNFGGGFVGQNKGAISASYAVGAVTGNLAGGFVGYDEGIIGASYAVGAVTGNLAGGFVGYSKGTITAGLRDRRGYGGEFGRRFCRT